MKGPIKKYTIRLKSSERTTFGTCKNKTKLNELRSWSNL